MNPNWRFSRILGLAFVIMLSVGVIYTLFGPDAALSGMKAPTDKCTKGWDGGKPSRYVAMVDCGSSGSRIHIYEFNVCQQMPVLVKEEFKMIEPGLSAYADTPEEAAKSLESLLQVALDTVPVNEQKCTPIAIKATAGLRKLGEKKSNAILDAVKAYLDEYPFPLESAEIMPGEHEGVYAWVTANYLLGRIGTPEKKPTAAVFDLGGGSTQIVFAPTWKDATRELQDGDHKFELEFGGQKFVLYQHSYLGYGLNEARDRMFKAIIGSQPTSQQYRNPCLPPNTTLTTSVSDTDGHKQQVHFAGPSVFSPFQCRMFAEKILEKDAVCALPPCSFQGVHQPPLFEAFPRDSDMFAFSFFYDRTSVLGMPQSFSLDELRELTSLVCRGADAYSAFDAVDGAVDALKKNPDWCADLNYMEALLRTGYDIKGHREVRIAKKINNNELGWCLGASLPLLDGDTWHCKN